MKTYVKLSILSLLFLAACSTGHQTAKVHDDIYFSRSHAVRLAETAPQANATPVVITPDESKPAAANNDNLAEQKQAFQDNNGFENIDYQNFDPSLKQSEYFSDEDGNTFITNNYFFDGLHHDYYYASRIRRFHRPWSHVGYYDPFFTDMFWYTYNPHFFGMSIYAGYDPFFYSGWGAPMHWGYFNYHPWYWGSYYSWGYRPWGWAHYGYGWGYGSPWGSYWAGHHYGYWAGYHSGYWSGVHGGGYGYPIVRTGGYDYGVRRPAEAATGTSTRRPGRIVGDQAGQVKEAGRPGSAGVGGRDVATENIERTGRIRGSEGQTAGTDENQERMTTRRGEGSSGTRVDALGPAETTGRTTPAGERGGTRIAGEPGRDGEQQVRPRYTPQRSPQDYANPQLVQEGTQQTPRYSRPQQTGRPEQAAPAGQGSQDQNRTRTYTSPSQQQPRSNQEYRRPAGEQRPATTGRQVEQPQSAPQRPQAAPAQRPVDSREQAAPQRTPAQTRPQAAPSRSPEQARPQATPQRAPERSTPQATPQRTPERSTPQAAPQRTTPQSTPQRTAPQRTPSESRPQAAPSSSPPRSSSPAVSSPSRGSSSSGSSVRSSPPSSSGSSGSSSSSSGRSGGRNDH